MVTKIRHLQVGLRVWSRGEIFSKKMNKKLREHKAHPPIITQVKEGIWSVIGERIF